MNRPRPAKAERGVAGYIERKATALDHALASASRRVIGAVDGEALHDLRVSIRRLRTLLRFARPVFGRYRTSAVRSAFTDVQIRTGELRDEEALAETLDALGVDDPAVLAWRARRRDREKRLRGAVVALLRAGDLARARRLLRALLLLPVKPSKDVPVGRFARRAVQRARKKVDALRDVPTSDVEQMHELRILYKELRYSAEIFGDVLPLDLAALAAPAARLQKRLGDIHDVDVALAALTRARGLPPESRAKVAGALVEVRARKASKYLGDMAPAREPLEDEAPQPAGVVALRKISTF